MRPQSIHNATEAAAPSSCRKRALRVEDEMLDNDDSKRRRYEHHNEPVAGPCGSSMHFTTTQPALEVSDHRGCPHFSEQLVRGRTRWREGSEPPNWDCREFHTRRTMMASYDDSVGTERNPHHNSAETDASS
ncbi:uncharacterized protein TRIVIDRAFT_226291 [Trichoderma virens Gv29-8]|uniref:Uncharacterized protein n=1 Tax=Hypocrea virens (strain Gv29-8 / FGSC 10586) TaxID=413071 RepID=G9N5Y9_HYPVG|nr:uncharacterized protein TRIVIDRAFT_226291 [Trichoderma virens Gv29-8]EHK18180.1 hypothetical protein TRIVIDRAFT_226291 [Trichoderma virens Gv29-8]UKZ53949.1 hypothetical protein TrVGV298_007752 [Trichoderma virens]